MLLISFVLVAIFLSVGNQIFYPAKESKVVRVSFISSIQHKEIIFDDNFKKMFNTAVNRVEFENTTRGVQILKSEFLENSSTVSLEFDFKDAKKTSPSAAKATFHKLFDDSRAAYLNRLNRLIEIDERQEQKGGLNVAAPNWRQKLDWHYKKNLIASMAEMGTLVIGGSPKISLLNLSLRKITMFAIFGFIIGSLWVFVPAMVPKIPK